MKQPGQFLYSKARKLIVKKNISFYHCGGKKDLKMLCSVYPPFEESLVYKGREV